MTPLFDLNALPVLIISMVSFKHSVIQIYNFFLQRIHCTFYYILGVYYYYILDVNAWVRFYDAVIYISRQNIMCSMEKNNIYILSRNNIYFIMLILFST